MFVLALVLALIAAFALGSIPWGLIVSRMFYRTDIRHKGSGNIGATNAVRTLGKRGGAAVFLLDFAKGTMAGIVAALLYFWLLAGQGEAGVGLGMPGRPAGLGVFTMLMGNSGAQTILAAAYFGSILGHIFSPWLRFKGGKGISVAVGCVLIVFGWLPTLVALTVFALLVLLTRYVSVGSMVAASVCPFLSLAVNGINPPNFYAFGLIAAAALVIIWAHRANILRLRQGTEHRLGD